MYFWEKIRTLFLESYDQLKNLTNIDINTVVEIITQIYTKAASSMIVKNKSFKTLDDLQPPWWDHECENIKHSKYALLRLFRLSNLDTDLQNYKNERNSFKNTCNDKKRKYEKQKREELVHARTNRPLFWKTLKQGYS